MSTIIFGKNRRQKPLVILCPAGRITVERMPHGTVKLSLVADGGRLELVPGRFEWAGTATLAVEEPRP